MDDHEICKLISVSVGAVMRQSYNDDFKEEIKNLLNVTNTTMVEELLHETLEKLISRKTTSKSVTSSLENAGSASTTCESAPIYNDGSQAPSEDVDSQALPEFQ